MAAASNNAILNVGRLNAFRLNYIDPALKAARDRTLAITLDGAPLRVRRGSLQIHDVINDAPNTATLTVDDATPPTVGGRLKVVLGVDPAYVLFVGRLQAARQSYVGKAKVDVWDCEAIDDTARADWLRPFGAWNGVSATTVAQQIMASFAPGYSSAGVQAGLPPVTVYLDGSERVAGALRLLAKLVGGYYYFEDYVLHLFTGDEPGANPDDVTGAGLLEDPRLTATSDDAQIRTRCYGKGHAEPTLSAVNAGDTLIPIANAVMFNPFGGQAISEWQRLAYTGTAIGGTGALVGPGVTPSTAPTAALAAGSGVTPGAHQYAYTWVTAAGETLPSPVAAAVTTTAAEAGPPIYALGPQPNYPNYPQPAPGTVLDYAVSKQSYPTATYETPRGAITSGVAQAGQYYYPSIMCTADMAGNTINLWRRDNGGAWGVIGSRFISTEPVGGVFGIPDTVASVTPRADPAGNFASGRVNLSGVSTGPAGVTSRKVYRTAANTGAPLKLLATLADNTTTSYLDALGDGSLGAAPPATDTSALQMPAGQVLPGAASMPVSGTGWARAAGGWVVVGNGQQVIRYTGITGNQITGIPASGAGAITAAVNYNSTITGAPMLIGVTGLGAALIAGAPINIWVQVDDAAAQSALAARVGGSGIVEQLIVDERRGEPSLLALCTADLALYGRPIVTIQYTTFDPKSRSGRPVRVHLAQPAIDQTLVIQDVTIGSFETRARFSVTASSIRTSLEDLLRRMVGTLEEGF